MIPAQDFKIRDGHESTSSDLTPMWCEQVGLTILIDVSCYSTEPLVTGKHTSSDIAP